MEKKKTPHIEDEAGFMDTTLYKRRKKQFESLELIGVSDIAVLLNWKMSKVATYMLRDKFPAPIGEIGGRPVWILEQINPYIAEYKDKKEKK